MSSVSSSSWQVRTPLWSAEPSVESDVGEGSEGEFDEEAFYSTCSPEQAGDELALLLMELKNSHTLSARSACVIAFWATRAGAQGMVTKLAFRPTAPSGHFSRHWDAAASTKLDSVPFYFLPTPLNSRCDASRVVENMASLPAHELLVKECEGTDMQARLAAATARNELPPTYWNHPVVLAARGGDDPVLPICCYMDGVAFARVDSVLGVWVYSMLTQVRHLVAVYRKSELCQCGCHGWCSLYALHSWLVWSFAALARGAWPAQRHDGTPFSTAADQWRQDRAGQRFGCRMALVVLKGDWSEYASTLGYPTWSSSTHPCPHCFTPASEFHSLRNYSAISMPHARKTMADYDAACAACEHSVEANAGNISVLKATLDYDKRAGTNSARGRALTAALPALGLQAHDRLEPSPTLPDIAALERLTLPARLTFWRRSSETMTRHRCPVFSAEIGITPDRVLGVDWLHTLSLGCFQVFGIGVFHALVTAGVWAELNSTKDVQLQESVRRMRAELFVWYGTEATSGRSWTRVQNITAKMVGTAEAQLHKLHASEANGFVHFAAELLQRHGHLLINQAAWEAASKALLRIYALIKQHPFVFPQNAAQELEHLLNKKSHPTPTTSH